MRSQARYAYRARLAAGHGYDDGHRRLLAELQRQQRAYRNKDGEYWISEPYANVADYALIVQPIRTEFI